jgi:hypothetical protein
MRQNPLTQKVNFYLSTCLILVFGIFMTIKITDFAHADNPITDTVVATQEAALQN